MASRRNYLTQTELSEFADITINDETEADDRISQAEELIDSFVGHQEKFVKREVMGEVSSATSTKIIDSGSGTALDVTDDHYANCEVEIIGGTGIGQRRTISSSNKDEKSITVSSEFTTVPDSTSVFRIYQLGKFPRVRDCFFSRDGEKTYKSIPEQVRRATAAQVAYMITMGDEFFSGNSSGITRERIGNYEYERNSQSESQSLIAPRARQLLRGITNKTGKLIA